MTVSIGGVTLSDHLLLPETKNLASRAMSVRTTLGGRGVIQSMPISTGQALELVDPGEGTGLFTGAQINSINVFKGTGETVALVHHVGSYSVVIEAVDVEQIDGYADPDDADSEHTYFGKILMRIVE